MPDKETINFELATTYLFERKMDQALVLFRRTYESVPEYDKAKSAYALTLMLAGKEAQARALVGTTSAILDTMNSHMAPEQYLQAVTQIQNLIKNP